jgi:hypothetical protein
MAQNDGYLTNEWMKFNISYITNGGNLSRYRERDGTAYFNAGPPYLATVRDMYRIAQLWIQYVPKVHEEYPSTFAEMYGYVIASTQLNLRHTLVKSYVVSTTDTSPRAHTTPNIGREGWMYVDRLNAEQVCRVAEWTTTLSLDLPIILHYCQRYILGKWFFSKYRLKLDFFSCHRPLLTYPEVDSADRYNYWIRPPPDRGFHHEPEVRNISHVQAKREAFMLCGMISSLNEAARYFKQQHCGAEQTNQTATRWDESYNFHDDPHST